MTVSAIDKTLASLQAKLRELYKQRQRTNARDEYQACSLAIGIIETVIRDLQEELLSC